MSLRKTNLVVAGGASHGWSLWGAYTTLVKEFDFEAYAGTSIGAALAAVVAFDIPHYKAEQALRTMTTNNGVVGGKKLIKPDRRQVIVRGGGMHDWSHVRKIFEGLFGDLTLGDSPKPLHIIVGDIANGATLDLNSIDHPTCSVVDALCASTALWPIADAQLIKGFGQRLFVDGGWGNNVPVSVFGKSKLPTLVVHLLDVGGAPKTNNSLFNIAVACLSMAINDRNGLLLRNGDYSVPVRGVGNGFNFSLSDTEIEARMMRGRVAALRVLSSII